MWVDGQRHAPAAVPPGKTRYPFNRRLGGPQGRSERVQKNIASPGFDLRTVQPLAIPYTNYAIPALQHFLIHYLKDHILFAIKNRYTISFQDSTYISYFSNP